MRALFVGCLLPAFALAAAPEALQGTQPLAVPEAEVPSMMIGGIDRFLTKQTEVAASNSRKIFDARTPEQRRERLAYLLGLRDQRVKKVEMEYVSTVDQPALIGKSIQFDAYAVRWRAFDNVHAEGVLLQPKEDREPISILVIPDADQTPEQITGLVPGVDPKSQYARNLASHGYRVLIPTLIDRHIEKRIAPGRKDGPEISNREYVFRTSYEAGRHIIGYELNKILAGIDWLESQPHEQRIAVVGWGEGGMLALYARALDTRIAMTCVGGYFGSRKSLWSEPIERNVWGRVAEFSDAELVDMATAGQSPLILEGSAGPIVKIASKGAAPGVLSAPVDVEGEEQRTKTTSTTLVVPRDAEIALDDKEALEKLRTRFGDGGALPAESQPKLLLKSFDPAPRQQRQLDELIAHSQSLIASSQETRKQFMQPLAKLPSPEKYEAALQPFRDRLYNDLLGKFDLPLLPPNVRTRKIYDTEKFIGYEVMLDVFPEVIAYGILLLPKDLKEGEKRPVVVCQHGLEGTPQQTITGNSHFYHDYAAKLAERGYITFSPQNPYILGEKFRVLSRKAWPIGKTMWSIIIPQHQQILNFLKALPGVDPKRIGFYGLSYGGKTAMRVPAVLTDYCLSICSGDFNEWVAKIVSTTAPFSYVFTHEYEIYEFDLASTFNHAEMAALIAPRPFMVERGHYDGVSSDEYVAWEFAKVRRLYQGQLKIPDRCAIEWFDGPHMINAKGTFEFLDKHLHPENK